MSSAGRPLVAFVMFVVLAVVNWFTYIFAILPIGMATGGCANGPSTAANLYTNTLGLVFALGAILPPALLVFKRGWFLVVGTLIAFFVINLILGTAQFWLPMALCK